MMKGKAIVIVGGTGSGKSTILKALIANAVPSSVLLYDVNNEYPQYKRYEYLPEVDDFILQAKYSENTVIACEEATIFFSTRGQSEDMKYILARKRHTHNNIILVFHALKFVPEYMFSFANYLILLKTTDTENNVKRRFDNDEITDAFLEIRNADWITNEKGDRYSPHKMVFIN